MLFRIKVGNADFFESDDLVVVRLECKTINTKAIKKAVELDGKEYMGEFFVDLSYDLVEDYPKVLSDLCYVVCSGDEIEVSPLTTFEKWQLTHVLKKYARKTYLCGCEGQEGAV